MPPSCTNGDENTLILAALTISPPVKLILWVESSSPSEPAEPPKPAKPPTPPPEASLDFSAMRELANNSARKAIAKHSRGQLLRLSYIRLLEAAGAIVVAIIILRLTVFGPIGSVACGVGGLILAIWWARQYFRMVAETSKDIAKRSAKRASDAPAAEVV